MTTTDPESIDERSVPSIPPSIAVVELDGEAVLLDVDTGAMHNLNSIGTVIWNCFDGTQTLGDIVGQLVERYQAEPGKVRRDVLTLAADLRRQGLLEAAPSTSLGG